MTTSYHLIASPDTWIEGDALRQLEQTAALPGMRAAVGLPDLHPGKGYPIGAALLSERIYPALVGNDIGCGMADGSIAAQVQARAGGGAFAGARSTLGGRVGRLAR